MRWFLAHDPGPLPHLFRVLWLFWSQRPRTRGPVLGGAAAASAGTLDPQPRAELAWVAAVTAVDTGDDAAALAARQRLAPLLAGIGDRFLHAASQLAMSWTLPIAGDFDGALREAAVSLEEFLGQDEPVFTAMAAFTVGSVETALGRYDDAVRHLREARVVADRASGDWLAAGRQVQLGILAVLQGRFDEARTLLEEALDLSLLARITQFVALCLTGYAWLALADGDLDQGGAGWKGQPRACAAGSACRPGRTCGRWRPSWWPRSASGWARTSSIRRSPPGSRLTQRQAVAIVQTQHRHPDAVSRSAQ